MLFICRLANIAEQLLIQAPVRVFDAVGDGVQLALREKLVPAADDHVRALPAVQVIAELRRVNLLVRLGIKAIPAQDMIARAANEYVCQQVRQVSLAVFNQLEVLLQVRRVNRQIRLVVLMEQLDLGVNIPRALVARRGRQETAAPACAEKRLYHLVPLCIAMAKVVALVNQHEIPVLVEHIFQQHVHRAIVFLAQKTH